MEEYSDESFNIYTKNNTYKPNLKGGLDFDGDRIWTDSDSEWHREDGPAVIYTNGEVEYMIHGRYMSKGEWIQFLKSDKCTLDQKTILRLILENS
jgi:hypothetical protein